MKNKDAMAAVKECRGNLAVDVQSNVRLNVPCKVRFSPPASLFKIMNDFCYFRQCQKLFPQGT